MLGAIIGDTVGSVYEFSNIKTTKFPLFSPFSNFTDDSVMTFAVADWLLNDPSHDSNSLIATFVHFANKYPCPMGGYGGGFHNWLFNPTTEVETVLQPDGSKQNIIHEIRKPYNSWGNGSAMRTSAVGWMFDSLEETERVAEIQASVTHNHPEGIKGAQATSAAIFLARTGKSKAEIKQYIESRYSYDLSKTCDEIRPNYRFEPSCQGTVPPAVVAFLESSDFESCLRLAVSLGGDCDTLTCISASIAEAFYKAIPDWVVAEVWKRLPYDFESLLRHFHELSHYKQVDYIPEESTSKPEESPRTGKTSSIGNLLNNLFSDKKEKSSSEYDLDRFVKAQADQYSGYYTALAEIKAGLKQSHWIWYIFPQLKGLGKTYRSQYYSISCLDEARQYLAHPVLGPRLREMCNALLSHEGKSVQAIAPRIDALKIRSSMTLFDQVSPNDIFAEVLETFYDDSPDPQTLKLLSESSQQ